MTDIKFNKGGRPAKGALKRRHKITVAFNDDEFMTMTDKAECSGLYPAVYCRKAAVQKQLRQAFTSEDRMLLKHLYNVGSNLNQVAHELHARSDYRYDERLKEIIRQFGSIHSYFREVTNHGW